MQSAFYYGLMRHLIVIKCFRYTSKVFFIICILHKVYYVIKISHRTTFLWRVHLKMYAGALNIKLHFSIFWNSLILLHSRCFFLLIAVFNKLLYRRNQWSVGGNKGIDFAYSLSVCGINKYWIPICNNLNTYLPMEIPVEIHWWNVLKKKKRNI